MSKNEKIRIVVIDDHPLFREGIKSIVSKDPRFEVAEEAGNARDGLEAVRKIRPDLVTVDLSLPDQNGIELTGVTREDVPNTPVMIVSMHSKIEHIINAIQAGATGYLLKESASDSLVKTIETVLLRDHYYLIWDVPRKPK